MTEKEKEFLLEKVFRNDLYAGWKSIADELLERGECFVAGENCIWVGEIGNFIKTVSVVKFVGCSLYKFDLDNFLSSKWYLEEIKAAYLFSLKERYDKLSSELSEIKSELEDITNELNKLLE
jgi:hypothetical protein